MVKVGGNTKEAGKPKGAAKELTNSTRASQTRMVNSDAMKAQGNEIFNKLSDEQKALIGSKSKDVAMVYPLYSESEPQTSKRKGTFKVLGGRFKNVGKDPIELVLGTVIGRENGGLINVDFSGENKSKQTLKPGEEIGLTNAEILVNFFAPEYARIISGGETPVRFRISASKKPKKVPGIAWTLGRPEGADKDSKIPSVNDIYKPFAVKNGDKTEVLEGYERFAPYLARKQREATGGSTGKGTQETYEFLALQNDIQALLAD